MHYKGSQWELATIQLEGGTAREDAPRLRAAERNQTHRPGDAMVNLAPRPLAERTNGRLVPGVLSAEDSVDIFFSF